MWTRQAGLDAPDCHRKDPGTVRRGVFCVLLFGGCHNGPVSARTRDIGISHVVQIQIALESHKKPESGTRNSLFVDPLSPAGGLLSRPRHRMEPCKRNLEKVQSQGTVSGGVALLKSHGKRKPVRVRDQGRVLDETSQPAMS